MTVHCDNMAVVEVVNWGYSKDSVMAHLLWVLSLQRLTGKWNEGSPYPRAAEDALSRNNMKIFFS